MVNYKRNKTGKQKGLIKIICLLITFFILVPGFGGCGKPTGITGSDETLNLYAPLSISKSSPEQCLTYADRIMEGYLVVEDDLYDEAVAFDVKNLDWDMQVTSSPNTFLLWLHTLNPVYYLSNAYVQTGNSKYMDLAGEILDSWIQYDETSENKNRYIWYDHTVAVRTENLIYYALVCKNHTGKPNEKVESLIQVHADWLSQEENYVIDHNHGIFEDGALIKCGYYLGIRDYIDIGKERLDKQLKYAFPNKAVHIENSMGYHIGLIEYLRQISAFLSSVGDDYSETTKEYFTGAIEFLIYAYQPDLSLPSIGDTYGGENTGKNEIYDYGNSFLRYIASKGKDGIKPEDKTKIFKNDGYVFIRENWDADSFTDSTWLMFKSGYNSTTHKHNDDLSIALYSKGYDIFIDPGMYNYMVGNYIHDYLNSSFAHNTIIVDDKSYPIAKNISEKAGILDYKITDQYTYIKGYNNLYETVMIDRSVIYINKNTMFLVEVKSKFVCKIPRSSKQ